MSLLADVSAVTVGLSFACAALAAWVATLIKGTHTFYAIGQVDAIFTPDLMGEREQQQRDEREFGAPREPHLRGGPAIAHNLWDPDGDGHGDRHTRGGAPGRE